ncbi:MAG: ATPase, T2SS/T4P/T4SS family [Candidatus Caenarcaniphilales bacterium]|nr:ATPase, T2SS/T4P/T4SS family [Candidatus Caenarcaniphilales bacterium]
MSKKRNQSHKQYNFEELERLLALLPGRVESILKNHPKLNELIDVVLDLGRSPELRFSGHVSEFLDEAVTKEEIEYICKNVSSFSSENRAGIEKTLHRISAIRNKKNEVIGLTCRVGRTVTGTVDLIMDLLEQNKSMLLLGPPGSGKTTKLRETSQIFADKLQKRVVIVDTSNEIGGNGDIPHASIGGSRRMPVPDPSQQHKIMIEAVENHTPEVIVIDEISTEEEAQAAQTIAERGVILIATAHGKNLESILQNPSLSILVGGAQLVTLSDEEAKRRKTQKSILERAKDATFELVVEIISHHSMVVHHDVNQSVDQILRGGAYLNPELRHSYPKGHEISIQYQSKSYTSEAPLKIYPYAVSHSQIYAVIKALNLPAKLVDDVDEANIVLALEDYANEGAKIRKLANMLNLQLETIKNNSFNEIKESLTKATKLTDKDWNNDLELEIALEETFELMESLRATGKSVELSPRKARIRKVQQELINKSGFQTEIVGSGSEQRIRISA